MQLKLNQLAGHLKKTLAPIYLISGDTTLLVRETRDTLREAAKKAGFLQRELLCVEAGFDWGKFISLTENFNLFSEKCLIEIQNPTAKFDEQGIKTLLRYLETPSADHVIVITCNKLTSAQKRSRWYKAIDNVGVTLPIWPIGAHELPRWIQQRMQQAKLQADRESIQLLADLTEGNLLATQQTIEKLRLLYPAQSIDIDKMTAALSQNARYNVFDLTQYALQGDVTHVVRIVNGLRDEGVEATFVLWALTRELRNLIQKTKQREQGVPMQQVLRGEWASRQALLKSALMRLHSTSLLKALQYASQVDQMIKGMQPGAVWDALMTLSLQLTNPHLTLQKEYA